MRFLSINVLLSRVFAAYLLGLTGLPAASANDALPPAVSQELRTAGIPMANVAVVVQEIGSNRALVSLNGSMPMNPASTMKLVTTYAGLELLGPAYRWHTDVYLD